MEVLNQNGKDPAYTIVASMFNAGQSALTQYSIYTAVTLKDILEEMAKYHPTSGKFTPNACDELFQQTPPSPRPVVSHKATFTDPPH
jgi:hypothetical protein